MIMTMGRMLTMCGTFGVRWCPRKGKATGKFKKPLIQELKGYAADKESDYVYPSKSNNFYLMNLSRVLMIIIDGSR